MKILVTGAKGQLGTELTQQGPDRGFSVYPVDLPEVDITFIDPVRAAVGDSGASLVVNCAAYTRVDMAESRECRLIRSTAWGLPSWPMSAVNSGFP